MSLLEDYFSGFQTLNPFYWVHIILDGVSQSTSDSISSVPILGGFLHIPAKFIEIALLVGIAIAIVFIWMTISGISRSLSFLSGNKRPMAILDSLFLYLLAEDIGYIAYLLGSGTMMTLLTLLGYGFLLLGFLANRPRYKRR